MKLFNFIFLYASSFKKKIRMIEINNLTRERINEKILKKAAADVLRKERRELDISVAVVGEKIIRELNKKYRKKDEPTDVLSFFYPPAGEAGGNSGEIVICPKQVKIKKEDLIFVLIHGVLHLLGYTHKEMLKKKI